MSKSPLCIVLTFLAVVTLAAQPKPELDKEKAAIKQAALDYAEGYYEGSGERMERAVHPLLFKRGLMSVSPQTDPILVFMNSEMLIDAARSGRGKLDPDKRNISFAVLDMTENTASARIFTVQFNDYLQLAKIHGQWRIVNVLWQPPVQQSTMNAEAERSQLGKVLADIREAANTKDADRMKHLIHPELIRRTLAVSPYSGKMVLQDLMDETMLQIVRMGRAAPAKDQPQPETSVLDMYENIASVKSASPAAVDYFHFAKQGGEWRLVNALRTSLQAPAAPPK